MILEKLAKAETHLNRDDLSPNQKKHLWSVMKRYGASQGFSYDRFFKEGFREWELLGIDRVKEDFLRLHESELNPLLGDEGDIIQAPSAARNCFYDTIGRARLKLAFISYMNGLGMGNNTVLERFGKSQERDFKDYERVGIYTIIEDFEREVSEGNIE